MPEKSNTGEKDQNLITIEIPEDKQWGKEAETLQIENRLIEGDLPPSIEFEARDEEISDEYVTELKKKGARIFIQAGDSYFIVHSEESLAYRQYLLDSQEYYQV